MVIVSFLARSIVFKYDSLTLGTLAPEGYSSFLVCVCLIYTREPKEHQGKLLVEVAQHVIDMGKDTSDAVSVFSSIPHEWWNDWFSDCGDLAENWHRPYMDPILLQNNHIIDGSH